jgi:hypothetical protein
MIFTAYAVVSMACDIMELNPRFVLSVLTMMYACLYGAVAMFRRISQNNYAEKLTVLSELKPFSVVNLYVGRTLLKLWISQTVIEHLQVYMYP